LGLARPKQNGWIEVLGPGSRLDIQVREPSTSDSLFKDIEKLESDLSEAADNLRANSKLTSSDYFNAYRERDLCCYGSHVQRPEFRKADHTAGAG